MIVLKQGQRYTPEMVGMIKRSGYWHHYSLIIAVEGIYVTELDQFGGVNHGDEHKVRRHCTPASHGDKLLTVQEFYELIKQEVK